MNATTAGIDLAKNVFEIALADERGHILERQRLSRARFDRFFANRPACRIVVEACGSAHHHARRLSSQGHSVVLLPAQYARAYVRRNKTDAADAAALIEASRCPDIRPVPIKSVDQQALQQLHRLRSQWMGARTSRINFLRSCLREFGVGIPVGAKRAIQAVRDAVASQGGPVPPLLHPSLLELLAEIGALGQRCKQIDRKLTRLSEHDPVVERLLKIPGVGSLTASAACLGGRHPALPHRSTLRQLARPHLARALLWRAAASRTYQQAGRSVLEDAAHPRGKVRADRGTSRAAARLICGSTTHLGARRSGTARSQQSHRCPRQQTRSHRLGHLASRSRLHQQPLNPSTAAPSSLHAQRNGRRRG